ncbi:unnamed protein product [Pedinophyceae sp. YPF-701]|nr:unnamed protein product [Pedinophyceae sp. YPF-701]
MRGADARGATCVSMVQVPVEAFSSAKVHDNADPSLSLDRYMRMPLEEFAQLQLPLGAKMTLAGNDHLELVVPDMRIFDLKISPHVLLRAERIEGDHPALVMHVEKFELQGSQAIIRALNEAVTVVGSTKFSWQSAGKDSHVYCSTNLELGGEPPGPFKLVPKGLLESTIATGMGSTVGLIQKPFMNRIADDFKRWASDPSFRGARAATGAGVRSQMALVGVGKSRGRDVRLGARSRKHEEA